jgi:hypothetical protein
MFGGRYGAAVLPIYAKNNSTLADMQYQVAKLQTGKNYLKDKYLHCKHTLYIEVVRQSLARLLFRTQADPQFY